MSVVLALAVFRIVRLLGWDDLPPIVKARAWLVGETWHVSGSGNSVAGLTNEVPQLVPRYRRPLLKHFLDCAFCQGFWTGAAVYAAWVFGGHPGASAMRSPLLYAVAPLALSAAVGLIAKDLDP